jgi:hypothetical protein
VPEVLKLLILQHKRELRFWWSFKNSSFTDKAVREVDNIFLNKAMSGKGNIRKSLTKKIIFVGCNQILCLQQRNTLKAEENF